MPTRSTRPRRGTPTRTAPAPTPRVYTYGLQLFVAFAAAMVVAFWPSYFSRLSSQPTYHPHTHGLTMASWVALLVGQAWLIRRGRRQTHRSLGLSSYVLVPALTLSALNFLHFRLRDATALDDVGLSFVTLVVNALVAFIALFGLAMWYRKQPARHARFMIATVFPLFTPVTDRLIGRFAPWIAALMPRIGQSPVVPVAGFLLADAILVGLSVWDWRTNRRLEFPVALGVLVAFHASMLTFHRFEFWQAFSRWFVGLPLS